MFIVPKEKENEDKVEVSISRLHSIQRIVIGISLRKHFRWVIKDLKYFPIKNEKKRSGALL